MPKKKLALVHPGEVRMEEFLKPLDISQYRLAKDIHVPPRRINEIARIGNDWGQGLGSGLAIQHLRY